MVFELDSELSRVELEAEMAIAMTSLTLLCTAALLTPRHISRAPAPTCAAGDTLIKNWAPEQDVEFGASLRLSEFGGERGVAAEATIQPAERVLAVPSKLALQVTSVSPAPSYCEKGVWLSAAWYTRLALRLLHEDRKADTPLRPWLQSLPREFDTPIFWDAAEVATIPYAPLRRAVERQREEWDKAAAATATPRDDLYWALSCARSRAFSGPFSRGSLKAATAQLSFAGALGLVYILGFGGEPGAAVNGILAVLVSIVLNDFLFARATTATRYVLCPVVDMINHDSSVASDVSYEYFTDTFAVSAGPARAGEQLLISYGSRSNDQLLQYYGFVEANNPNDAYVFSQEEFLLALNAAAPYDGGRLQALRAAELTDASAAVVFSKAGADERALRLGRLLLADASADGSADGRGVLLLAGELAVLRALADVADGAAAALQGGGGGEGAHAGMVAAFCAEKRRVLGEAAAALRARADAGERRGAPLPYETAGGADDAKAKPAGLSLPGLGLSRID